MTKLKTLKDYEESYKENYQATLLCKDVKKEMIKHAKSLKSKLSRCHEFKGSKKAYQYVGAINFIKDVFNVSNDEINK